MFLRKLIIAFILFIVTSLYAVQLDVPFLMHQDSTGGAIKEDVTFVTTSQGESRIFWNDYRNGNSDILGRLLNQDGTLSDNGFTMNDDEGFTDQTNPVIDINNIDYCVMVWEDEREGNKDIYGQKIGADLFILGENFKVNSTTDGSEQQNPVISLNDSGEFVIVWEDDRNGNWDIFAQRFDFWGLPAGENFQVNELSAGTDAVTPSVYFHNNGQFVICWCDERNGNHDLYLKGYNQDGSTLFDDVMVNDDLNAASQSLPAVTFIADTGFVVWVDNRNGNSDIFLQKFTMDGQLVGSNRFIVEDEDGDEQNHPAIHSNDSLFIVVWDDYRHGHQDIYSQAFTFNGDPIANNFKINTDTTYREQSHPEVYVLKNGAFVYSWVDYRQHFPEIYAQQFSAPGVPTGDNVLINQDIYSSNQENMKTSMNHSGLNCTVWQDERNLYSDIYLQFCDNDGEPIGKNIQVNTNTGSRYQTEPDCAVNDKGEAVIVWRYDDRQGFMEIRGQRFDADQIAVGENFQINSGQGDISDNHPSVAIQNSGDFSVVWRDEQGSGYGIYLRQYNTAGDAKSLPMLVNDNVDPADLKNPAVAVDSIGNTMIVWEDNRNGEFDIFCQWIDSTGVKSGNNILVVDDSVDAYQGAPQVSMNSQGDGVIVWRDNRTGYPRIFAQYFNADSGLTESNFLVQDVAEPIRQLFPDVDVDAYGNFVVCWQELHDGLHVLKSLRFDYQHEKEGLTNYLTGMTNPSQNSYPQVALSGNRILYAWQDANRSKGWDVYGRLTAWERLDPATSVDQLVQHEQSFNLIKNYPNPFNHETMIQYRLNRKANVIVSVLNVQGKTIRELFNSEQKHGDYTLHWDGKNQNGLVVSSGIYLVQVKADSRNIYHRMMLIK